MLERLQNLHVGLLLPQRLAESLSRIERHGALPWFISERLSTLAAEFPIDCDSGFTAQAVLVSQPP